MPTFRSAPLRFLQWLGFGLIVAGGIVDTAYHVWWSGDPSREALPAAGRRQPMTAGRVTAAFVGAVLALAGLVGCSSGSSRASRGTTTKAPFSLKDTPVPTDRVELPKSYRFQPAVIEVKRRTTVTWTNHDDFPHTVQVLAGADPGTHDLGIGKQVTITFDEPGTVYYHCSLHPAQMKGEIIVTS